MATMHELYGDGSGHEACEGCGACKDCGDCICTLEGALRRFEGFCPNGQKIAQEYLEEAWRNGLGAWDAFVYAVGRTRWHGFFEDMGRDW